MTEAVVDILLLEDEPAHAEAIRRAFEASDLKAVVQIAGTLREFHEIVVARLPNIVLMDMVLPDGRALDALTSLQDACPFPILILTSYGNEQTAVDAMKAGALDYIVKSPEAFATMPHAVERALREWNVRQERKQASAALRESEKKYRLLIETANESIVVAQDGLLKYVNPVTLSLLGGYSEQELVDRPFPEFIHPDDRSMVVENYRQRIANEAAQPRYAFRVVTRDGIVKWVEINAALIEWQGKPATLNFLTDITTRKMAEERLNETLRLLRQAITSTIQVLGLTVEARDPYTAGHQQRTTILAEAIAREMGLPPEKIEGLHMAGLVHDVGKIAIPAEILSKPTTLTPAEYALVKTHATKGFEILKDVAFPWPLDEIVYQHHERMDGSGYPRGLKGDEILMEARILSVSDTVEAMVSDRPYRPAQGVKTALAEVEKNKGIFYDADVAETCLKLFREKRFSFPA